MQTKGDVYSVSFSIIFHRNQYPSFIRSYKQSMAEPCNSMFWPGTSPIRYLAILFNLATLQLQPSDPNRTLHTLLSLLPISAVLVSQCKLESQTYHCYPPELVTQPWSILAVTPRSFASQEYAHACLTFAFPVCRSFPVFRMTSFLSDWGY